MKHMLKNKNTEKPKNTEKTFFRKIKVGLLPSKTISCICFYEIPLKMMNNAFYFILKVFSFSRYLNFCIDFLAM